MRLLAAITALFLAALVSAQDANVRWLLDHPICSFPLLNLFIFKITVGVPEGTPGPGGDDQFSPSNITAKNGSVITFTWKSTQVYHTITPYAPYL